MYCYTKNSLEQIKGTVLFLGDSITDDGRFISFINTYMRLAGNSDCKLINAGVSSETASGLTDLVHPFERPCVLNRIDNALQRTKPDWVVLCYGINDGIYQPYGEERALCYEKGMTALVKKVKDFGAKAVVMTPMPYDHKSYKGDENVDKSQYSFMNPYENYDEVMESYAEYVKTELSRLADVVIDIRTPLIEDLKAIRENDKSYISGDSIHPNAHGHAVAAGAIMAGLFGISTSLVTELILKDEMKLFEKVYAYDRLEHSYYKEYIGHDNPYKDVVAEDWQEKAKSLDEEICEYIKSNAERFETHSKWNDFDLTKFIWSKGYEILIAEPENPLKDRPWIWRTEFFGAFPSVDLVLLKHGYHVVQVKIPDMYGCPAAIDIMAEFHDFIAEKYSLAAKTVLFGFSRGGLYAANYAARYPQRVSMLYLDAPVVDIRSWPMGKAFSKEGAQCRLAYGDLHDEDNRKTNMLRKLIEARLPLLLVAGDSDEVVPYNDNGEFLEKGYKNADVALKLVLKAGIGHHPHSLENPFDLAEFIILHS